MLVRYQCYLSTIIVIYPNSNLTILPYSFCGPKLYPFMNPPIQTNSALNRTYLLNTYVEYYDKAVVLAEHGKCSPVNSLVYILSS